ncbi:hypothetical protein HUT18_14340 [Streptomyces sp. NA04227]|uniref:hypothetical protein n=1 Tax=Streptomyces sp. NA04227 TaxID=2742136 RepID=UPI001590390B|nr:hypothetical protein [Streptomyces sp. NA04227]QKW07389.1 hypothetical protein HUT18_14340 [Streptomyces sp. NA04227]
MAEFLSTVGFTPQLTDHGDHLSVEAEVLHPVSSEDWQELVTALDKADWFGLVDSSEKGRRLWAAFTKEASVTASTAVRRQDHQL